MRILIFSSKPIKSLHFVLFDKLQRNSATFTTSETSSSHFCTVLSLRTTVLPEYIRRTGGTSKFCRSPEQRCFRFTDGSHHQIHLLAGFVLICSTDIIAKQTQTPLKLKWMVHLVESIESCHCQQNGPTGIYLFHVPGTML
jgi:hypothetical protein